MYKKNLFLQTFFILLALFSVFKLYDNANNLDAWQFGEWLINYQNGFVRRGLIGELIYLFSNIFNNNIKASFLIVLSIFVIFYYFLNFQITKNLKLNFINYFIIFSPLLYLFFVVISKVGVKKEIFLYIFYIYYLLQVSSKNYNLDKNWKFIFIFPLILLIHEGMYFYIPYLILPLVFIIKKEDYNKAALQFFVFFLVSSLVEIVLYFNKGTIEHVLVICSSLAEYAPQKCEWWGPIWALSQNLSDDQSGNLTSESLWFYLNVDTKTYIGFITYLVYAFLPLYLALRFMVIKKRKKFRNKITFYYIVLFSFIFSLPIFHLTHDWSRWFSIHFHLLVFNLFYLQNMKLVKFESSFLKHFDTQILKKKFKNILLVILFVYGTFLHHHHFFFKGVRLEFTYYKIFSKIFK
mgnify:CR=1 FL=1